MLIPSNDLIVPAKSTNGQKRALNTTTSVRPASGGEVKKKRDDVWLRLLVTVNDGHDIFVDVHDLKDTDEKPLDAKNKELRSLASKGTGENDVVIAEVRDISRDSEGRSNVSGGDSGHGSTSSASSNHTHSHLSKHHSQTILQLNPEASEASRRP